MKITVTLELREDVVERLREYSVGLEASVSHIVERDYKNNIRVATKGKQFDGETKEGILRSVFYYQKKQYGLKGDVHKFLRKWLRKKRFSKIFDKYEESGFKKELKPVIFNDSGRLGVCHRKYRSSNGVGY